MMCKAVVSLLFLVTLSLGLPTGAPPSACQDMLPGHGVDPQPDPAPYHLMISTIEQGREYECNNLKIKFNFYQVIFLIIMIQY